LDLIKKKHPRLICLPNPDSPTGHVISKKNLSKILIASKKSNSIVLIDEAYYLFTKETVISNINKYNNFKYIFAGTQQDNTASIRLYKKNNFVIDYMGYIFHKHIF